MVIFDIDEQESGKHLVYEKKEDDTVDALVMGMMENNKIEGTVPFTKSQVDTVISYRYNITGLQSVAEYLSGIVSRQKLLGTIENFLGEKKVLEEYMLDMDAVVWDNRYLFVDPAAGDIKVIVLPVKHDNLPADMFFRNMVFSVQYDPAEDVSYVTSILNYFNGMEPFTMSGFGKLVHELKEQQVYRPAGQQYAGVQGQRPVVPQGAAQQKAPVQRPVTPGVQNIPGTSGSPAPQAVPPVGGAQMTGAGAQDPGTTVLNNNTVQDPGTTVLNNQMTQDPGTTVLNNNMVQDPGTTVLNNSVPQNPGATQHYVNPNLARERSAMAAQSTGGAPKTYPGTNQGVYPGAEPVQKEPESAPVKEKKGLFGRKDKGEKGKNEKTKNEKTKTGLFGKKEKTESPVNPKAETSARPKSFHGIAIPGSDVVPKQENNTVQPTAIPAQNVSMQVHAAPIQNFGETVDLQSYTNAVSGQTGPTASPARKAYLIRKTTREQFALTKEMTRVGRSRENVDIYITDNTSIGRVHAVLYLRNGRVFVEDQSSKNGTFLNGHRVNGQEEVVPGAHLSLSNEEFEIVFS